MYLFCALIDRPSVDREIDTSTTKVDPFPRVVHVISTSSYEVDPFSKVVHVITTSSYAWTLLLNKKTMFLLKEQKLRGALKLLLFKV